MIKEPGAVHIELSNHNSFLLFLGLIRGVTLRILLELLRGFGEQPAFPQGRKRLAKLVEI